MTENIQTMNLTVGAMIGRGVLFLILGILLMVFTATSAFAIAVLMSIFLIFIGIAMLAGGLSFSGKTGIAPAILGILVIILGIITLFNPVTFFAFLVYFIAIASIVYGIFEIIAAIISKREINRGLLILAGIIGIVFGAVVLIGCGLTNVFDIGFILTWIAGIFLALIGVISIIEGIILKSKCKKQA